MDNILVRVEMDSVPGKLAVRQEYSPDGTPVCLRVHSHLNIPGIGSGSTAALTRIKAVIDSKYILDGILVVLV